MPARPRAVHGVALLFLANGLAHPALWPRLPEIRDAVGASDATFGLALVGTGLGGGLGAVLAPRLTRLLGVERAAIVSAATLAVTVVGVALAPSVPALFVALALVGLTDGLADVGQNALLFDVQRGGSRSLASRMHAVWSAGALVGTAAGAAAVALRASVLTQCLVLALVGVATVAVARQPLRGRPRRQPVASPETGAAADHGAPVAPDRPAAVPTTRRAAWLSLLATAVVVAAVEGTAYEWSALALRDGLGASVALAGLGPTTFTGAMLAGRLLGDRAIDRFGARTVARAGGAAVAAGGGLGLGVATTLDLPLALLGGLAVAGLGAAVLFPLMLAAGDGLEATGRGVAVASLGARAGFLAVPLTVGVASDATDPAVAFALLPVAGLASAFALPRALARGRT